MKKQALRTGLFVMVLLLALPSLSFAQESVQGTGTLHAEGKGTVTIQARPGTVDISGSGVLTLVDLAGDAAIQVTGSGTRSTEMQGKHTVIRYRGFNGQAHIEGSHYIVRVRGRHLVVDARGTGRALLQGQGTYEVNGTQGNWTINGVAIQFDAPSQQLDE